MKRNIRFYMALIVIAGLIAGSLGTTNKASAHVLADTLPTTKTPSSAHFDFTGTLKSSDNTGNTASEVSAQLSGMGAISGKDIQEDETISIQLPALPGGSSTANETYSATTSIILTGGKGYFKVSGLGGAGGSADNQWYETDLSDTAGLLGTSAIGGMLGGSANMSGLDPAYSDAFTVTQVGKEAVEGAPTTRYHVVIDFQKLISELSPPDANSSPSNLGIDYTVSVDMWIGDSDQYVHKLSEHVGITAKSGDTQTNATLDLTMTFRDFDTPITITAPANAQPLDSSSLGPLLSGSGLSGTGALGMPTAAGGMLGMPGSATGTGIGMPRTGGHNPGELPIVPLSIAFAALLVLFGGFTLRRLSTQDIEQA